MAIVVTPIVVHSLGIKQYGIYTFFNTVISMLGLLDLGISTAVNKYLAEYYAQKNSDKIKRLLGTSLTIFCGIGAVGLVIFVVGSYLPYWSSSFSEYSLYHWGILAAGATFAVASLTSLYTIIFFALQRFDVSSKIGITILTIQQISILVMVSLGYSINTIFTIQLIIACMSFLIQRYFAHKILPELRDSLRWDVTEAIKCYKFGLITFINNISTSSLTYLDRLIMPFFLGPSSLTYYSLPGNVTNKIPSMSNSLSVILFPMASGLHGTGDTEKLNTLYIRSFRLITVVSAAVTVTAIAYAHQVLQYWISSDLADKGTTVLIILAVTNFILALTGSLSNFLLGMGKLKFLTTLSIVMAATNTILLLVLLPLAGINGAAWAYLLSLFPVAYMFYFTEKHYLKLLGRRNYYVKILLKNVLVGIVVYSTSYFLIAHIISSLFTALIACCISGLLYLGLYWAMGFFEKEDVDSIKLFAGRVLGRIR